MWKKPERIAWITVLLAFMTCIVFTVGGPLSVRWFILNSTRPLKLTLETRAGAVTVQEQGRGPAVPLPLADSRTLPLKSHINGTTADADALLLVYPQENPDGPLVTAQLYGEADVTISAAHTPRFSISPAPHHVTLRIDGGPNLHISVNNGDARPTTLRVNTPQGPLHLDEGAYTLIVSPEKSVITVRTGQARIVAPSTGEVFVLTESQRTELTTTGLSEFTTAEHDVLDAQNGDFDDGLKMWEVSKEAVLENESAGIIRTSVLGNARAALFFERVGQGHASTGIVQELNQDIRGAQSLKIQARLRVDLQLLPVCGSVGTECPLMLRFTYTDDQGYIHEWLQGFYVGELTEQDPAYCPVCGWDAKHIRIPQGTWYDYESQDLLPLIRKKGFEPVMIYDVQVYASGHTYASAIDKIAIFIEE